MGGLLVLACVVLAASCGGDEAETTETGANPPAATVATPATTSAGSTVTGAEDVAPDPVVGGARVACAAKSLTIEFSPESGASFSAGAEDLTHSGALRTSSVYEFARGCTPAGNEGGAVPEPYDVVTDDVTLRCEAATTIDLSGRAGIFDNRSGYELSAAPAGSAEFFVKTHYELRGGPAYLIFSPKQCTPGG